jgi:hypothetical protein
VRLLYETLDVDSLDATRLFSERRPMKRRRAHLHADQPTQPRSVGSDALKYIAKHLDSEDLRGDLTRSSLQFLLSGTCMRSSRSGDHHHKYLHDPTDTLHAATDVANLRCPIEPTQGKILFFLNSGMAHGKSDGVTTRRTRHQKQLAVCSKTRMQCVAWWCQAFLDPLADMSLRPAALRDVSVGKSGRQAE